MTEQIQIRPLTASAAFALTCAGFDGVYIYDYRDARWWMVCNGIEYWVIEDEIGVRVVENVF